MGIEFYLIQRKDIKHSILDLDAPSSKSKVSIDSWQKKLSAAWHTSLLNFSVEENVAKNERQINAILVSHSF